jgi:hypothetical protein
VVRDREGERRDEEGWGCEEDDEEGEEEEGGGEAELEEVGGEDEAEEGGGGGGRWVGLAVGFTKRGCLSSSEESLMLPLLSLLSLLLSTVSKCGLCVFLLDLVLVITTFGVVFGFCESDRGTGCLCRRV